MSKSGRSLLILLATLLVGKVAQVAAAPHDHFLCYTVKPGAGASQFQPILGLSLADSFEQGAFDVKKPVALCTPAQKNHEPVGDPDTHLKGYQIKPSKGTARHIPQSNLRVVNQLGEIWVDTIAPDVSWFPASRASRALLHRQIRPLTTSTISRATRSSSPQGRSSPKGFRPL